MRALSGDNKLFFCSCQTFRMMNSVRFITGEMVEKVKVEPELHTLSADTLEGAVTRKRRADVHFVAGSKPHLPEERLRHSACVFVWIFPCDTDFV